MRLHKVLPEYQDRVKLRIRPFPLGLGRDPSVPRDILEQEWWLAALQEPAAEFSRYRGDDWPGSTLPAFEAAWCAAQQGEAAYLDYDLRVRRAFFAEGRNIGRSGVLMEIAKEAGLDMANFSRAMDSGEARGRVVEEARLGRERYKVHGTPTVMLADGTRLALSIAFPTIKDRKVAGIGKLPCWGEGCVEATRNLFERALNGG